jgi:2-polyprenyl-6-methoxyphenol hydroxylase-like FAD-dependent oxidoreductase
MSKFHAIIIGGGPVGLSIAHALAKADIDFTLLERRASIVEDIGASIVLSPQSMRVMGHLGMLDQFRDIGQEVLHLAAFTTGGKKFMENWYTNYLKDRNGSHPHLFHRADVVRTLYENLSESSRAKIQENKKVIDLVPIEGGVRVICADGTEYSGSVVIGADGVHSKTRHILHELAGDGGGFSPIEKTPFNAEYRTLFCSFPRLYEFAPGDFFVTHAERMSLQLLVSRTRSWIFIYEHIHENSEDKNNSFPFSEKDIEAFVHKHGDINIADKLKFKDVWDRRYNCGLTRLEEGVMPRWSWGRVVLAGDACHKFTPNAGMGFNSGLQDVVSLVNELNDCIQDSPESAPSDEAITEAFTRYETERIPTIKKDYAASAMVTRMCAWPSRFFWFFDQYILGALPWLEGIYFKYIMPYEVSRGLVFNFLKAKEPFSGSIPWVHTTA